MGGIIGIIRFEFCILLLITFILHLLLLLLTLWRPFITTGQKAPAEKIYDTFLECIFSIYVSHLYLPCFLATLPSGIP
jgi:hypothetical protein